MQCEIVRTIAFREHQKISISAMTRYGKSFCIAIGIALIIDFGIPVKIAFIGPKQEQAGILREYMADLMLRCDELLAKADIDTIGTDKIRKETSKKRMTFKTGAEYRVFSAEGEADRLMGFGAGIVLLDERVLIPEKAEAKISRMLGDNPKNYMLIESYNPWDRASKAFQHTLDPDFYVIHIDWRIAVKEGRTTQEFVDMQRKELTPLEFEVLYESRFPEESEDSLHSLKNIMNAENQKFKFMDELIELDNKLKEAHKYTESEINQIKKDINKYKVIIACDPADKGLDETVIMFGIEKDNHYQVIDIYSEPKSESMQIVGYIINRTKDHANKPYKVEIKIDKVGIGVGAFSRLKEIVYTENNWSNVKVKGCGAGEQAIKKDHYINQKAENNFRLRDLFIDNMMGIPEHHKLRQQLISMKWELTSTGKKKVIDPEDKSPDYSDCLVIMVWRDKQELLFEF
jgi:hypothetical protein